MLEVELKSLEGAGQDEVPPVGCLVVKRWWLEKAEAVTAQERRLVLRKREMHENRMVNLTKQASNKDMVIVAEVVLMC